MTAEEIKGMDQKPIMRPVFGNFAMNSTKKIWAIYINENTFYTRNGWSGGFGTIVAFKSREAAEAKIAQLQ